MNDDFQKEQKSNYFLLTIFQLADQQAAHFGAGCWERGDIKISLGTGTFVSVNTKDKAHASMQGQTSHSLFSYSII